MEQNLRLANENLLTLTESAKKKVLKLLEKDPQKKYLRVKITGGGCSGLSYELDLEQDQQPYDLVINSDIIAILIDPKSALYLKGTTLDYSNKMIGGGFKFLNPNAKTSCSCGDSFSI